MLEKIAIEPRLIQEKFLSGKLNIKNFTEEKISADISKLLPKDIAEEVYTNEEVKIILTSF